MGRYDAVVAGAGISGLLAAIQAARSGANVLIIEEKEVGWKPCGGLTTINSLKRLGIPPLSEFVIRRITDGKVHVRDKTFDFSLRPFNLIVVDRRSLDLYLAKRAISNGAELAIGERLLSIEGGGTVLKTDKRRIETKYFIDARGSRIYGSEKLPAYQFTVTSKTSYDEVHVWVDRKRFPEFFAWYIPTRLNEGKLGGAGAGVLNSVKELCEEEGFTCLRVEYASIVLGGPMRTLVRGRTLIVGDAAGQAKPTTGGGIYTGGMGGILAGKWVSEALIKRDPSLVKKYEREWRSEIGHELVMQRILRKVFLRLEERQIERVLEALDDISELEEAHFNRQTLILKLLPSIPKLILTLAPELKSLIRKLT